jgi:uncharacterized membrane protein YidH (DUF202 family)
MIFDFCNPNWAVKFLAFIIFLGGLNWLVTAIRSFQHNNQDVDDLFELINVPQVISNIIYCIVFVVSLIVLYRTVVPATKVVRM